MADARIINLLVVHVTDSPDDRDLGFKEIDQWHKERGFDGVLVGADNHRVYCGYHYIIRRDGVLEIGRPEMYVGAHVKGHNKNSIGIVWVGKDKIDPRQYVSLIAQLKYLMTKYGLTTDEVKGHHELNPDKTCPNLNMNILRSDLNKTSQIGLS